MQSAELRKIFVTQDKNLQLIMYYKFEMLTKCKNPHQTLDLFSLCGTIILVLWHSRSLSAKIKKVNSLI